MQNAEKERRMTLGGHLRYAGEQLNAYVKASPARMAALIALLLYFINIEIMPAAINETAIFSIIMSTTLLAITASGQTIVLIGGGMDFGVGAVMSAAAIITTYTMNGQDGRVMQVMALALGMGALVGLLNGICCVKISLPPMVVTMAIANVVTRLQYVFTAGSPEGYAAPGFSRTITTHIGVVPSIVFYGIAVFSGVLFLLNRSRFGKQLYMVGNNRTAARLNGVRVNRVVILSYVFSGLLSAFAGVLGAGYMSSAKCQVFDNYAFTSLVAVIVGGTSLNGGIGSFSGTLAGALLMVVLSNLLNVPALALTESLKNIINGAVIIALLALYNRSKAVRQ